jgi:predicted DNA-binding transcriptional regulator AlpA
LPVGLICRTQCFHIVIANEATHLSKLNERRRKQLRIVPIARTTLFRMIRAGTFPAPTYISPNRRVCYEDQIIAWQGKVDNSQPNRRRKRPPTPRERLSKVQLVDHGCAWNAVSAFANCGRAVAHVRGQLCANK